ncbi:MAG TPA: prepilin-type N-terminal cleavage/methylation domain-containing protein [Verrucomicrobiae bacterium]|jgi:prepilin-type N-terminal cleavage/methylation domain-containing protein/prepilin-type processing-associated H-X9-DG protein
MIQPRQSKTKTISDGFTLTELLVAIAIIGILASLLLTALSSAKSYSRSAACVNNLRQMGVALKMYVEEHQSRFPYYLGPEGPSYGDDVGIAGRALGLVYWSSKLFPYFPLNWTNAHFQCPGYAGITTGPTNSPAPVERRGSYGYNIWGSRVQDPPLASYGIGPIVFWKDTQGVPIPAVTESEVVAPSEMLSIGDSAWIKGTLPGSGLGVGVEPGGDDILVCNPNSWAYIYDQRHGEDYNQLRCDGHVSRMRPQRIFTPSNSAAFWNYDHQPHPEGWTF